MVSHVKTPSSELDQPLFKFWLNNTLFAVPADEVLYSAPPDNPTRYWCIDEKHWIRRGRLLQPEYFESYRTPSHDDSDESASKAKSDKTGDPKAIRARHKATVELYKQRAELAEAELKQRNKQLVFKQEQLSRWQKDSEALLLQAKPDDAGDSKARQKATTDLYKQRAELAETELKQRDKELIAKHEQLRRWQDAYETVLNEKQRAEREAERHLHQRIVDTNWATRELADLSNQVDSLRGDFEVDVVADEEITALFDVVCEEVKQCSRILNALMSEALKEYLIQREFPGRYFGSGVQVLELLMQEWFMWKITQDAERQFLAELSSWHADAASSNVVDTPSLLKVEAKVFRHVMNMANTRSGSFNQKDPDKGATSAREAIDSASIVGSYYRWRSNTTMVQAKFRQFGIISNKKDQFSANGLCGEILQSLMRWMFGDDTDIQPHELFQLEGYTEEICRAQYAAFEEKLAQCVSTCLWLFWRMRMSRAHWALQWSDALALDQEMDEAVVNQIYHDGRRSDDQGIASCVLPALVRYGSDYGKDFHLRCVHRKAQVMLWQNEGNHVTSEHEGLQHPWSKIWKHQNSSLSGIEEEDDQAGIAGDTGHITPSTSSASGDERTASPFGSFRKRFAVKRSKT